MSESLKFFNQEYAKYWSKKRSSNGLSPYDAALFEFIKPLKGKILEVAIGSGKPFATMLAKPPFAGCDISFPLLKEGKSKISSNLVQSNAENMPFADKSFDAIYCFHSTWFFQNLGHFVLEAKRVLKPSGCLIFDIMNAKNSCIQKEYLKNIRQNTIPLFILFKYAKNILKIILRKGTPIWQIIVPWKPAQIEAIEDLVGNDSKASFFGYQKNTSFILTNYNKDASFQKIVVKIIKIKAA